MKLTELESVAKAATPGPWTAKDAEDGFGVAYDGDEVANLCQCIVVPRANGMLAHPRKDALYIAAMSPDVALKLIAVAQAAKRVAFSNGFDAALPDKQLALRNAIAALERT